MRILITSILIGCLSCISGYSFSQTYFGHVVNNQNEPVEFATVVLLKADEQAATAITDTAGVFSISTEEGKYHIRIQNITYKPLDKEIEITREGRNLGLFRMEDALINTGEVVVTASPITRESDRFVMRISDNSPSFMNKDISEVLQLAPGVWVDEKGISINGTAGAKVFINDRELKLSSTELISYLRNYRSSDIAKIEVIPQAGAEYSADSKGGIIQITLRKRQGNGINGSLNLQSSQGKYYQNYRPSASINALTGRWALSGAIIGEISPKNKNKMNEHRIYKKNEDMFFDSYSSMNKKPKSATARFGAIYDIDKRNSIGAELEIWSKKVNNPSYSETTGKTDNLTVHSTSVYQQIEKDRNGSLTMNFNHRIDTLGSIFKVVADFIDKKVTGNNDYHSIYNTSYGTLDSVYRNSSTSDYRIYTTDIMLEKRLKNGFKYNAGIRYSQNEMTNSTFYEGEINSEWQPIDKYNYSLDYIENISAAYGTFSFKAGHMDIVAGLRGEYTKATGKDSFNKDYVDLFPNLNLTYSFNSMKTVMLIGQYARNIQRPNFWHLNSNRIQYSDYSYMVGNPMLRPTYINRISLTAVYKYRHTLTIGTNLHKDLIREISKTDSENPEVKYFIPENHYMENHHFIAISSPISFTNWLTLNTNLVGVKQDIKGVKTDKTMSHYLYFINSTANLTLPASFFLEVSYSGTSRLYSANSGIEPLHLFHAQLKKKLFRDRINLSIGIHNIFDKRTAYFANMEDYTSRTRGVEAWNSRAVKISLQYTFNSGKILKKRVIESQSNVEKARMQRSSEIK